jgi:hypothetical protein
VKVTCGGISDTSNGNFDISPPIIDLTAPDGGQKWVKGSTHYIRWSYFGKPGPRVRIDIIKGGRILADPVVFSTPTGYGGAGNYSWRIPADLADGSDYLIRISSIQMPGVFDRSNQVFTIIGPRLILISPNGGERWVPDTVHNITWKYYGSLGTVKIELLKSGLPVNDITNGTVVGNRGSGKFSWKIPRNQMYGKDYTIRITSNRIPSVRDKSSRNFTITPNISVLTPNGGERLASGWNHLIAWSFKGNAGPTVKLVLLKDGAEYLTINTSTPIGGRGEGRYNWLVPDSLPQAADYRIRVMSTEVRSCMDSSDNNFSIIRTFF